jgi:uncharacterized protein (DUF885 family)
VWVPSLFSCSASSPPHQQENDQYEEEHTNAGKEEEVSVAGRAGDDAARESAGDGQCKQREQEGRQGEWAHAESDAERGVCAEWHGRIYTRTMRFLNLVCNVPVLLGVSLVVAMACVIPARAQHVAADGAPQTFGFLVDQYFSDVYFRYNPTAGTSAGLHQYDTQLEDYSPASIEHQRKDLNAWLKKFNAIDASALDQATAADHEILVNSIRSTLLDLDVLRPVERDPNLYPNEASGTIFVLMERPYAPANTRLRAVVTRQRLLLRQIALARTNLKNPPKIYTQIAIEQIDGIVSFFQNDVPAAFTDADDAQTKADFAKSNAALIDALQSYGAWMKSDLLARSSGDFRYGADTFTKALAYNEMVDIPLPRLLEIGLADLHKNQAEFARVAKEIDPNATPEQELAALATMHPAPDKLIDAFHARFDSEVNFIRQHHIITIPSDVQPVLEETPPFMRATTQASMDPPGPYETHSKKAYFNVTLPNPAWSAERTDEYMAAFNLGTIVSTSVHEAYPGHYVQFLWSPQVESKVRKLIGANTNIEGWAHYCEQMMLDQGYAAYDPTGKTPGASRDEKTAKLIRLGQLQDALLRDARFVVAIRMHTGVGGPLTLDQAEDYFVKEGYQARPIAEVEVKRGTSDALYLYYTLGKLEIMKLRADVMAKQGAAFSLETFHNDFMRQGFAPIKVIRKAMLGNDSPVL